MAKIHFRDDAPPETYDRIFVAENGWVAVTDGEGAPVMYPPDRVARLEGDEDVFYDTVVMSDAIGGKRRDEQGRAVEVPEQVTRMVHELEIE